MDIIQEKQGETLIIHLVGDLNNDTYHELEDIIPTISDVSLVYLDFEKVNYVSSAGLRTILSLKKKMDSLGTFYLQNCNEQILELLEMTGFANVLNIER